MRKFRYIDTEANAWKYYPRVPIVDRVYSEDVPHEKETLDYWKTSIHFEVEFKEVLDRVITPDLFESYLEGMYDAFGGDSGDNDLTRQILGKVLNKYKGLNK